MGSRCASWKDLPEIASGIEDSLDDVVEALLEIVKEMRSRRPCRSMSERQPVGLLLGVTEASTWNGGNVSLALAMKDTQKCSFLLAIPDKDVDGQPILDADGNPFVPTVEWSTTDGDVASVNLNDGNPLDGFIGSGKVGQAVVELKVGPYPDGSILTETINVSIGNSEPGPLALVLGEPELEPKPA
jgi:hypothetical protein